MALVFRRDMRRS